jgi:hypothetical protein
MNHGISGLLALGLCGLLACGGGDDDGDQVDAGTAGGGHADAGSHDTADASGGDGEVTCTVSVSAEADTDARTITGVGALECTGSATLSVQTCVQWDASGDFEDIGCFTRILSDVDALEVEQVSSCGIGSGQTFRARVNASVDGSDFPEELSDELGCDES